MACFLVPTAEAVVTTVVKKVTDKKGNSEKGPFVKRLNWLNNMLWGGSALLAFEHVWHGEITPWFPFLTNAATPESVSEMFFEMSTSGVAMAVLVTGVWAIAAAVTHSMEMRKTPVESLLSGGDKS